jgi:hypothetical protein
MEKDISPDAVCVPSEDVVTREIDGTALIIPLVSGIVEIDGELFALNPTGRAIWQKLDGKHTLRDVAVAVAEDFAVKPVDIEDAVVRFARELFSRKLLVTR